MSSTENNTNGALSVPPANTITLKTADGEYFDVEESIAMEFLVVKNFFEDNNDAKAARSVVPLPNVCAKYMSMIIQYCGEQLKFREESGRQAEKIKYDEKFVEDLNNEEMVEMILAVNYLCIKSFMDMLTQAVANRIKNWSVERVRDFFGIENDFTPEEEAKLRQEYPWAYEGVEN
ncbi:SKP1-like protein 14 [Euphorbia lathyris]|uniref:SKP1-like protein 14 n=1 Tax=Euphorbia lathyris TaxID=212925 RepID=UPI003313629F